MLPAWIFAEDVSVTLIREEQDLMLEEVLIVRCWADFKEASSEPARVAVVVTFIDDRVYVNGVRAALPMSDERFVLDLAEHAKIPGKAVTRNSYRKLHLRGRIRGMNLTDEDLRTAASAAATWHSERNRQCLNIPS